MMRYGGILGIFIWSCLFATTTAEDALQPGALLKRALEELAYVADPLDRVGALREVANTYAAAGERELALGVLEEAANLASRPANKEESQLILAVIAADQARLGDLEGAIRIVGSRADQNFARSEVAMAAGATGKMDRAREIANGITDDFLRDSTLVGVAEASAEAGYVDAALEVLREVTDEGLQATGLLLVALSRLSVKDFEDAEQLSSLIKNPLYKGRLLLEMCTALAEAQRFDDAWRMHQQALAVAETVEGNPLQWKSTIVRARLGDVDGALAAAQNFDDADERDSVLLEIATIQARSGDVSDAEATARMIQGGESRAEVRIRVALAQGKDGDGEKAKRTLQLAVDDYHASRALSQLAGIQSAMGDREAASATFREALRRAELVGVGRATDVLLFVEIATDQAEAGDPAEARRTFDRARSRAQEYAQDMAYYAGLIQELSKEQARLGLAGEAVESIDTAPALVRASALLGVAQGMLESDP